jgi:hypothetical protein
MKVFKVMFENNTAISAIPSNNLQHSDIGLNPDHETVSWLAIECESKQTAMEIADMVVKNIWGYKAA